MDTNENENRKWNAWLATRTKEVVVVGEMDGQALTVEVPVTVQA